MAEEAVKKLEEQLNCAICLDTYIDPKLLQCFHVFCKQCLVKLVVRDEEGQLILDCPTCRQITPIPARGVSGLLSAFHINHLLEIKKSLKKVETFEMGPKAIKGDTTQKDIISSGQCSVHNLKELELYCETCEMLICSHCALRGQKHHSHQYDMISSSYERYKEDLTAMLEPMEKKLGTIERSLAQLDRHCGKITTQQATIEMDISNTIKKIQEIFDARKEDLIKQLEQMTQEKLKDLAIQKNQMESIHVQLSSCIGFLRESLQTKKLGRALEMKATLARQVTELATDFQPDVLRPSAEANIKFSSSPNFPSLCQNFGQLFSPGSTDSSRSYATGKGLEVAVVGEKSTVILHAVNFKGKPLGKLVKSLECEVVSEITGATVSGIVTKQEQSQYELSYQPIVKGRHQLHIKVDDQHIKSSPFTVTVKLPVEKIGTSIRTISGLKRPWGVAINLRGDLIVTEWDKHCASIFSPNGKKLQSFGKYGTKNGQFIHPCGLTVDGEGNAIIADNYNCRIQKFTSDGLFLAAVGTEGNGPLQFDHPKDIAFNASNDKIYVVDKNNRVQVLNPDLTFSSTFGKTGNSKGQFNAPWGIACDSTGNVYVADSSNNHIQVFTADGHFLRKFQIYDHAESEAVHRPVGITIDANDFIYISESWKHRVFVLTSEGQFVTSLGQEGTEVGKFECPRGLAVADGGVVYVCDRDNNRIQIF